MSAPKHTRWEVRSDEIEGSVWIAPEGDNDCGCGLFLSVGARSFEERVEQAQLAAAAPAMLEALQRVERSGRSGQWEKVECWMPLVRAAIAQATGEEASDG